MNWHVRIPLILRARQLDIKISDDNNVNVTEIKLISQTYALMLKALNAPSNSSGSAYHFLHS